MALKKMKKKHSGGAVILPAFVTETLGLEAGEKLYFWVDYDKRICYGRDRGEEMALGSIKLFKPTGFASLQISIPRIWIEHHGIQVGDNIDILVSVDCFTIKAVNNA